MHLLLMLTCRAYFKFLKFLRKKSIFKTKVEKFHAENHIKSKNGSHNPLWDEIKIIKKTSAVGEEN